MSISPLLRFWKCPRTTSELATWKLLEESLNAQLLHEGEGPLPPFSAFLQAVLAPKTPEQTRKRKGRARSSRKCSAHNAINNSVLVTPWLASGYFLFAEIILLCSVGAVLLGAGWAGYELYRILSRIANKARRPSYYEAEARSRAEKLKRQRSQSHRIRRRTSFLKPPTGEMIREAWTRAHTYGGVQEKLQLGAMLATLEASVDNGLLRDQQGEIIGRKSGIKGWIAIHCSDLLPHYSSLMRFKAAADKHARTCDYMDPCPTELLLSEHDPEDKNTITVGTISKCIRKKGARQPNPEITITVGIDFEGKTMRLRGIKEEITMEDIRMRATFMAQGRRNSKRILEEAKKRQLLHSFSAFNDFLFERLGLVHEKRLHTSIRRL